MRLFYICAAYNCTVLKHILKIYKVAVMHMLCKIVCIVEMTYAIPILTTVVSTAMNVTVIRPTNVAI